MAISTADWKQHVIQQKNPETGCIPWCFAMLLKKAGQNLDWDDFQDQYDFDKGKKLGEEQLTNHFSTVAEAVNRDHPPFQFQHREFATGTEKVAFIEQCIADAKTPVVSLLMRILPVRAGPLES